MSDSVRPQRRQPTRLPRPWDSPGKNTGVGCHFLLQCMKVNSESEVAQSCPTVCDPMDCRLPAPLSMGFSRQEYWRSPTLRRVQAVRPTGHHHYPSVPDFRGDDIGWKASKNTAEITGIRWIDLNVVCSEVSGAGKISELGLLVSFSSTATQENIWD